MVTAAPSIRQLYWCDFPQDAQLPEFWKRRPVIIVSFKNTLHGAVTVVPCSTAAQPGNKWAFPLQTTIDRSEEHTSELQSLMRISYAVFCLKKKITKHQTTTIIHSHNKFTTHITM